jgi:cell division protein FtsQ
MLIQRRQNKRRQPKAVAPRPAWRVNWLHVVAGFIVVDVMVLMAWGVIRLSDPNAVPIRGVKVVGEFKRLQSEHLQAVVADQVRDGFFALDVTAVQTAVSADPWVQDVAVRRIWPDRIEVAIAERHAVARWGKTGLLTATGELFRPPSTSFPEGLVTLDGPEGTERQVLERLAALQTMLAGVHGEVTTLVLNPRRSWSFTLANGTRVRVGRSDFEGRVQRFAELYNELVATTPNRIEQIDLRYTNGFAILVDARDAEKNG